MVVARVVRMGGGEGEEWGAGRKEKSDSYHNIINKNFCDKNLS